MVSVLLPRIVERVRNFVPEDTSTKATGFNLGCISVFTEINAGAGLTLTGFETRVGFANDVDTALATYNLAVGMAVFERLE